MQGELSKDGDMWKAIPIQAALLHAELDLWGEAVDIIEIARQGRKISDEALQQVFIDLKTLGCPRGLADVLRRGWKLPASKST